MLLQLQEKAKVTSLNSGIVNNSTRKLETGNHYKDTP